MSSYFSSVLITGSNRGIGLEFVKQLLSLPQPPRHLFATCRDPKNAAELLQLAKDNSSLRVLQLNVTNAEDIKNVASEVASIVQDEGLGLLINNAAGSFSFSDDLINTTEERMINSYRTNTVAPLMIVQALRPLLKRAAQKPDCSAAIVNISSRTSSISDNKTAGLYPSRACKAALNIITKSLSIDLKPDDILALVIDPGWVQTKMGGENAKITPQASVSGMIQVISSLDASKSGSFYNYKGENIPW